MVYRGRPSRDCLPCRKRKLRCDLVSEGCGQCLRAKLKCHGYRDPDKLLFCDETRTTTQKAIARQASAYAARPTALEVGWDVRARYAFFSIYIFSFSRSCDAVASFYSSAPAFDHLSASIEAISLAFMAIQSNNPGLIRLSSGSYVTAIQRLGQALNEPQSSDTEEVLQSILLLDMYEKMVNRNPQSSPSWMSHARGGMSLLETRGEKILSSFTGRQLAVRLATVVSVSCATAAVRVPDALISLRGHLDAFINGVKWGFTGILAHVIDLQADLRNSGCVCSIDFAKRAKQLDDQFKCLESALPPSWQPRRVFLVGHDTRVFGHYYDIYPDHFIAQVSNGIRAMRLVLNDIVQRNAPDNVSSPHSSILSNICDITQQICAAVPQFILPGAWPDNALPFSPLQGLRCYSLLPPLYFASQVSTDYRMREWIESCLMYISETGHIRIANDVADIMKSKPALDYWAVYAMVGSYVFLA